jgi:dihydrofolate reductase
VLVPTLLATLVLTGLTLRAGLLDDITVTVIPVLLGAGRPLFGPLDRDVELTLMRSRAYEFGFVQSTYRVDVAD